MAEAATALDAERHAILETVASDPANPGLRVKAAQVEAKIWLQNPEAADLRALVEHLDIALKSLPEAHRANVKTFAVQVQQRGADIASIIKGGGFPRLLALLTNRPMPDEAEAPAEAAPHVNGAVNGVAHHDDEEAEEEAEREAPTAARQPAVEAEEEPEEAEEPAPAPHAPEPSPLPRPSAALSPDASSPNLTPMPGAAAPPLAPRFKEVEVGEVNNQKIREWLARNQIVELASAFPLMDNFRTRRLAVDKVAETKSAGAVAALLHMLAHENDTNALAYLVKKLKAYDMGLLIDGLQYDPRDNKHKQAVVRMLAELKNEATAPTLKLALGDPDPAIRIQALSALAAVTRPETGWIKYLCKIVRYDRDPKVRAEAARTLQALDSREAYMEFDLISKQTQLDGLVSNIYKEMSKKFLESRIEVTRQKRKQEEAEQQAKLAKQLAKGPGITPKQIGLLVVVAIGLGIAGVFTYAQIQKAADPYGYRKIGRAAGGGDESAGPGAGRSRLDLGEIERIRQEMARKKAQGK